MSNSASPWRFFDDRAATVWAFKQSAIARAYKGDGTFVNLRNVDDLRPLFGTLRRARTGAQPQTRIIYPRMATGFDRSSSEPANSRHAGGGHVRNAIHGYAGTIKRSFESISVRALIVLAPYSWHCHCGEADASVLSYRQRHFGPTGAINVFKFAPCGCAENELRDAGCAHDSREPDRQHLRRWSLDELPVDPRCRGR
jgi:hypothetical protein